MTKVSIIIPVYNKEKYLQRSINSVLTQSYSNIELIIVNDGSEDNSSKVIKEIEDDRIVYYEQKNQGVSAARNKGIELATGEYISFLDADDEWDTSFIEEMLIAIKGGNVCYCGTYVTQENKIMTKKKISFVEGDILEDYLLGKNIPHTNCWLLKKNFLVKHSIQFILSCSWGEDMNFLSKVLYHDNNVRSCKKYLSTYFIDIEDSLSSSNMMLKIDADIKWTTELRKYMLLNLDGKDIDKYITALESYRIPMLIIYRIYANRYNLDKKEIKKVFNNYNILINKMKIMNGLRGVKLYYTYTMLKLYMLL